MLTVPCIKPCAEGYENGEMCDSDQAKERSACDGLVRGKHVRDTIRYFIAARYGGKLYAAHVISLDDLALACPEALDRILKEANDYAECALGERLATARRQALPCEALIGSGDITIVLRGFVEKYEADLVVVGTKGREGLGKVFHGSVAEGIIREAPCPALTVGAKAADMTAPDIRNILCAIDFSQESLHASEYAFFLAQELKAHLALLHVVGGSREEPPSHAVLLLSQALRELTSSQPQLSCEPEIMVTGGPVADRILEFAAERSAHHVLCCWYLPSYVVFNPFLFSLLGG